MDRGKLKDRLNDWGAVVVVAAAVIWGMTYKGFSGETLADAVKDVGAALVPIFAAVLAARKVLSNEPIAEQCERVGEEALKAVQKRHPQLLSGPKYNRDSYDSEKPPGAGRYLFVQAGGKGQKGQLVPSRPFREGVVQVQVSKTSLIVLGLRELDLLEVQGALGEGIEAMLKARFPKASFELVPSKNPRVVRTLDFDEVELGARTFGRIVEAVAEEAMKILRAFSSPRG